MRRAPALETIWKSGLYIGNNRANAYVTVNPTWHLALDYSSGSVTAKANRLPFRRWANTGTDIDVPRSVLRTISISRALDQDCAQLTITFKNVNPAGGPNIDDQGYFSIRQMTRDRWPDRSPNVWGAPQGSGNTFSYGRLAPGNLLKTFQGYGGYQLEREAAIAAGNVVPTGVWIIDDTQETAQGELTVTARDVGQLLVDQTLYPPLMPDGCYPTQFYGPTWNTEVNEDENGFYPTKTNYKDIKEIVELLALWAGFHSPDLGGVLGTMETTGIDSKAPFQAVYFDKKPVIDPIKELSKIVGYRAWVDQEGGFQWTSQNVWEAGNRTLAGVHSDFCFDFDELATLSALTSSWTKRNDRSRVVVSQGNPQIFEGVKHATFVMGVSAGGTNSNQLHGMEYPLLYPLDREIPLRDMVTLAELTGLRIWFSRHKGNISGPANPLVDVDDQVRVWERTTHENYLQRVRAMNTEYDEVTGKYTMSIDGSWCGPAISGWRVQRGPSGNIIYNGSLEGYI